MTKLEMPKNLAAYVGAWALLANWDESIGGKLPKADNIADAIAVMSKPGGKPAVLNQGLRALALGFRPEGSTDGQRAYASMAGSPHNNVGKLGDALRSQYKTSRLETGKAVSVTLPGGIVSAVSNKSGHIALTVTERFTAPAATAETTPAKPKLTKAERKAAKAAAKAAQAAAPKPDETPANGETPVSDDTQGASERNAPVSGNEHVA